MQSFSSMKLLLLVFISLSLFSCQPGRKNIAAKADKENSNIFTTDITPLANPVVEKEQNPYTISSGKHKFKVGQIKYQNIQYIYDKKKNLLQLKGKVDLYDKSLVKVLRSFNMDVQGYMNGAGLADLIDEKNKRIFAKITCLRQNADQNFTCEDVLIDLFLTHQKQLYTEQLVYYDKKTLPAASLRSEHLPEAPAVEEESSEPILDAPAINNDIGEISAPKITALNLSEQINDVVSDMNSQLDVVDENTPNSNGRMVGRIFEDHEELLRRAAQDSDQVENPRGEGKDEEDSSVIDQQAAGGGSIEVPPALTREIEEDEGEDDSKDNNKTSESGAGKSATRPSNENVNVNGKNVNELKAAEFLKSIIDVYADFNDKQDFRLVSSHVVKTASGDMRPYSQINGAINGGSLLAASNLLEKQKSLKDNAHFRLSALSRNRYYGSFELVEFVPYIAHYARQIIPGYELRVSDLSQKTGGPLQKSAHRSHQTGMDVDLAYLVRNPQKGFASVVENGRLNSEFLVKENFNFLMKVVNNPKTRVTWIFTDKVIKTAMCKYAKENKFLEGKYKAQTVYMLSRLRHTENHDDHFHLRIACSKFHPRCKPLAAAPNVNDCT